MKRKNAFVLRTVKVIIPVIIGFALASFASVKNSEPIIIRHSPDKNYQFIVRDFEGKITVFDSETNALIEQFDVYVSALPDPDAKRLEKGIPCEDRKQLQSLIEDLTS